MDTDNIYVLLMGTEPIPERFRYMPDRHGGLHRTLWDRAQEVREMRFARLFGAPGYPTIARNVEHLMVGRGFWPWEAR